MSVRYLGWGRDVCKCFTYRGGGGCINFSKTTFSNIEIELHHKMLELSIEQEIAMHVKLLSQFGYSLISTNQEVQPKIVFQKKWKQITPIFRPLFGGSLAAFWCPQGRPQAPQGSFLVRRYSNSWCHHFPIFSFLWRLLVASGSLSGPPWRPSGLRIELSCRRNARLR